MDPLLLDLPTEFYSERLFIRMPKPGDGNIVYEAISASIQELKPWMPFAYKGQTEEETESNLREAQANFLLRKELRLLVFHKETGEFIASSGLHHIDWRVPKFEIGYWIDKRHSGNGYITEAVQRITEFAFEELQARRVEICCDERNKNSRAVAERLGFSLDCVLKNDAVSVDGKDLRNTCIYSKTS
nr:GNAT family N-acetyltransferase [Evansella caseinilytica]